VPVGWIEWEVLELDLNKHEQKVRGDCPALTAIFNARAAPFYSQRWLRFISVTFDIPLLKWEML